VFIVPVMVIYFVIKFTTVISNTISTKTRRLEFIVSEKYNKAFFVYFIQASRVLLFLYSVKFFWNIEIGKERFSCSTWGNFDGLVGGPTVAK